MVIVVAVTVAVALDRVILLPLAPAIRVTVAVTVAAVLNLNPVGAFSTKVPVEIPLFAVSDTLGPVKLTQVALAILLLGMGFPPVATVTLVMGLSARAGIAKQASKIAGIISFP